MPTYINNTKVAISVTEVGCHLLPGENRTIIMIPDNLLIGKYNNRIEKTDDFPLYNPLIAEHHAVFTGCDDGKEITLNLLETDFVEFSDSTINVTVYIENDNNDPPIRISAGERVRLRVRYRVSKLILKPENAGEILIKEMKDEIKYDRWDKSVYTLETIQD